MTGAGGVGRWTRYFALASALSMVAFHGALSLDFPRRAAVLVGLFGAVLPMVFGMAYLLLPSYVGRTLPTRRLPGVHFALAYAGTAVLVADGLFELDPSLAALGGVLWSAGVAVFVGVLLWTVVPAVAADPEVVLRSPDRPQRSTRVATATIPVAVGYLVVGTVALLSTVTPLPGLVGATFLSVVHYYATGFAALLIFALGMRLVTGFFHVSPPRYAAWVVLSCGAVAPGLLAPNFWRPPWFLVGAGLESAAMVGYLGLVAVVAYRTDRRRVGLYGIALGALGGAVGVGVAALVAFGAGSASLVAVHVPVVLDGFLLLTILGYAYQFFPVTTGRFAGASERTALTTFALLALGVAALAVGALGAWPRVRAVGVALALLGTIGYAYLMTRRLLEI